MIAICTNESFLADALVIESWCPVCCQRAKQRIGWVGSHCSGCDSYFSMDELQQTVRKRRELLGLSREEMAERTGLALRTIKNYEKEWPSRKYWNVTRAMVEAA